MIGQGRMMRGRMGKGDGRLGRREGGGGCGDEMSFAVDFVSLLELLY